MQETNSQSHLALMQTIQQNLQFTFVGLFGDIAEEQVQEVVAAHCSFRRLTKICDDLQSLAQ